jgi:hypothetical protein
MLTACGATGLPRCRGAPTVAEAWGSICVTTPAPCSYAGHAARWLAGGLAGWLAGISGFVLGFAKHPHWVHSAQILEWDGARRKCGHDAGSIPDDPDAGTCTLVTTNQDRRALFGSIVGKSVGFRAHQLAVASDSRTAAVGISHHLVILSSHSRILAFRSLMAVRTVLVVGP